MTTLRSEVHHSPGRYLEPDHQGHVGSDWIQMNGFKSYVEFRDVHGRDWRYDVEEETLKPIKRRPSPLKMKKDSKWAAWWIVKNEAIYYWRNHPGRRKVKPTEAQETQYPDNP